MPNNKKTRKNYQKFKNIKKKIKLINKSWAFNKNVSVNFDNHVRKSVPFYNTFQKDIAKYAEFFLKDRSLVYDLGCSTGQTIKYLSELNIDTKFKVIGIDNSKSMIKIAKNNMKKIKNKNISIDILYNDVNKLKLTKSNLIYSILLMPFLSKKNQFNFLKKSYSSLENGGGFICVNKILSNNSQFQDIFNQLYYDFKARQKISATDIIKKSRSLRSIMTLNTEEDEIKNLKKVGFKKIEVFFKYLNFIGILAIK